MKLVIVESPSKAKTINKYLGKDYLVKASKGHVVDLPKSNLGVDVEKKYNPSYEVTKRKSIQELKSAYKNKDGLILAVDLDREGEAIGWHVAQKLGAMSKSGAIKPGHSVERIVFSEITEPAIKEAIQNPRKINMDLVNAQQARRILDRLVGYKLSPVLWKKIAYGLSAGRVQSVALRLVVEKEEERNAFKSEEYWGLEIYASKDEKGKVKVNIIEKDEREDGVEKKVDNLVKFELVKEKGKKINITNRKEIENILSSIDGVVLNIDEVLKKVTKRYPKPPLITSTLQQMAINRIGFSAKKTMSVAQKLYEKGLITYMRTDSTDMSNQAIEAARDLIKKEYGEKYLPAKPNVYKKKSKTSQEAHECIRPVNFKVKEDSKMTSDEKRLYHLIRGRALSSQMTPAEVETVTAISNIKDLEFRATGSTILFQGFLKAGADKLTESVLPHIEKDDKFYSKEIFAEQHFTQPPARYSEASLIKKLEELEIGRPSTYSSIISTILSRKYVEKDGRYLFPTDTGVMVNKLLVKYFKDVVDYGFTSDMETNLDKVAEGDMDWVKMLDAFYKPFEKVVETNTDKIPREEFTVIGDAPKDIKCPECGSPMKIKLGKYGRFYSCSKWPECKGMLSTDGESKEDVEKEAYSKEFLTDYEPAPKTDDGRDYLLKKGKFGKFWAHPDYPKVKDAKPLELRPAKRKELYGDAPKTKDGRDYLLKGGRFGMFWAHPDYPKEKDIVRIPKKKKE